MSPVFTSSTGTAAYDVIHDGVLPVRVRETEPEQARTDVTEARTAIA